MPEVANVIAISPRKIWMTRILGDEIEHGFRFKGQEPGIPYPACRRGQPWLQEIPATPAFPFHPRRLLFRTVGPGPRRALRPDAGQVVERMLEIAQVGPNDVVYDLGSGDGRIVIAAAKRLGARGVGIDIDPDRIAEARATRAAPRSRASSNSARLTCSTPTSAKPPW